MAAYRSYQQPAATTYLETICLEHSRIALASNTKQFGRFRRSKNLSLRYELLLFTNVTRVYTIPVGLAVGRRSPFAIPPLRKTATMRHCRPFRQSYLSFDTYHRVANAASWYRDILPYQLTEVVCNVRLPTKVHRSGKASRSSGYPIGASFMQKIPLLLVLQLHESTSIRIHIHAYQCMSSYKLKRSSIHNSAEQMSWPDGTYIA